MRSRILARASSAAEGFDGAEECVDEEEEDEDANLEIGVPGAASGLGAGLPGRAGCFPFAAGASSEQSASMALAGGAPKTKTSGRGLLGKRFSPWTPGSAGCSAAERSGTGWGAPQTGFTPP